MANTVATDEAGMANTVATDEAGMANTVATDEAGMANTVATDEAGMANTVATDEAGMANTVATDEAGMANTVATDEAGMANTVATDEAGMANTVATNGPLPIAVDALDHGVLIVGYSADYWISGYIRLSRGSNQCGLTQGAVCHRDGGSSAGVLRSTLRRLFGSAALCHFTRRPIAPELSRESCAGSDAA
eukprot:gene4095-13056_t